MKQKGFQCVRNEACAGQWKTPLSRDTEHCPARRVSLYFEKQLNQYETAKNFNFKKTPQND